MSWLTSATGRGRPPDDVTPNNGAIAKLRISVCSSGNREVGMDVSESRRLKALEVESRVLGVCKVDVRELASSHLFKRVIYAVQKTS